MWGKLWEIDAQKYIEKGDALLKSGKIKEGRLEYLKAIEILSIHGKNTEGLEKKINDLNTKIVNEHEKKINELIKNKEYMTAISELEYIYYLVGENKKNDIEKRIIELKKYINSQNITHIIEDIIKNGDEFLENGYLAEALMEYKEALKFDNININLKNKLIEKIKKIEEIFLEKYLKRAKKFEEKNKNDLAVFEYEKALSFASDNKKEEIIKKIKKLSKTENSDDAEWEKAYQEFREALEDYLSFDYKPISYWFPNVINPYESHYKEAKYKLGKAYYKKALNYYENGKFNLALKHFQEATNYFEKNNEVLKEIYEKIKEIKHEIN